MDGQGHFTLLFRLPRPMTNPDATTRDYWFYRESLYNSRRDPKCLTVLAKSFHCLSYPRKKIPPQTW